MSLCSKAANKACGDPGGDPAAEKEGASFKMKQDRYFIANAGYEARIGFFIAVFPAAPHGAGEAALAHG